jgi:hypothetical protein
MVVLDRSSSRPVNGEVELGWSIEGVERKKRGQITARSVCWRKLDPEARWSLSLLRSTAENAQLELSKWRLVFSDLTPQVSYSTDFALLRCIQHIIFSLDLTRQKPGNYPKIQHFLPISKVLGRCSAWIGTLKGR